MTGLSRGGTLLLLLLGLTGATERRVQAQASVRGELEGAVRLHVPRGDQAPYPELLQRLRLVSTVGPWELSLMGDGVWIPPWLSPQPIDLLDEPWEGGTAPHRLLQLEKSTLRYRGDQLEATLGDFHASLGRGIALSLLPNQALDLETTVKGARLVLAQLPVQVEAMAGRINPRIVSLRFANQNLTQPPTDLVGALRLEARPLPGLEFQGWSSVFAYSLWEELAETPSLEPALAAASTVDVVIPGGSLSWQGSGGLIEAYVEANRFYYRDEARFETIDPEGLALYFSASAYLGLWTLSAEGLRYRNTRGVNQRVGLYGFEVVTPPTLELAEAITRDSAETLNSPNLSGWHLRLDRRLEPAGALASLHWAQFYDLEPLPPTPAKENIGHVYGSLELSRTEGGSLTLLGGYRLELRSIRSQGYNATPHGSLELRAPRWGAWTGDLHAAVRHFEEQSADTTFQFTEAEAAFSATWRGELTGSLQLQYTDDPVVLNSLLLEGGPGNLGEPWFGSLGLEVRPSPRAQLQAFWGARRAGLQCAGGQCRFLPAFSGLEFRAQARF